MGLGIRGITSEGSCSLFGGRVSVLTNVFPSDLRLSRSSCDDVTHDETAEEGVWTGYRG